MFFPSVFFFFNIFRRTSFLTVCASFICDNNRSVWQKEIWCGQIVKCSILRKIKSKRIRKKQQRANKRKKVVWTTLFFVFMSICILYTYAVHSIHIIKVGSISLKCVSRLTKPKRKKFFSKSRTMNKII